MIYFPNVWMIHWSHMLNKLLDGRDEGEGELGENLVFTSHQLIFRLFTLSAELLGEQGGVGSCSWRSEQSCCPCSHLVVASVTVEWWPVSLLQWGQSSHSWAWTLAPSLTRWHQLPWGKLQPADRGEDWFEGHFQWTKDESGWGPLQCLKYK